MGKTGINGWKATGSRFPSGAKEGRGTEALHTWTALGPTMSSVLEVFRMAPCEGTVGDWDPAECGCGIRAPLRPLLTEVSSSECVYSSIEGEEWQNWVKS